MQHATGDFFWVLFFFQAGWSPLMTVCSQGYLQVVEVLLDGGAHPDLQSKVRRQYSSNAFE